MALELDILQERFHVFVSSEVVVWSYRCRDWRNSKHVDPSGTNHNFLLS